MNICVFCSSRNPTNSVYRQATTELGQLLAKNNHTTIYGGSNVGLMALLSEIIKKNHGRIIGVLPEVFSHLNATGDEIVHAKDFAERKAIMITRSDAFICLPGGHGTIDEFSDVIVSKLINIHAKPLVFINTDGFYDNLLAHFKKMTDEGFIDQYDSLYGVVNTPEQALQYILNYKGAMLKNRALKG